MPTYLTSIKVVVNKQTIELLTFDRHLKIKHINYFWLSGFIKTALTSKYKKIA